MSPVRRRPFVVAAAFGLRTRGQGLGWLGLLAVLLGPWTAAGQTPPEQRLGDTLGPLPASFVGDLPCADCPGIRYQLDLYPDQAFVLRMTYLGREPGNVFDEIGGFLIDPDARTLMLVGGREAPTQFRIENPERLRLLDLQGQEIVSELNYILMRAPTFTPIEPRVLMRGMYQYLADAAQFQECLTRWRLPVAQEADNVALERAYLAVRRQPGEALLVNLEGQIALRPKMEGEGEELALVPLRFIGIWPGETCGARFDTAPLENSYWKLTRLGNAPVIVAERQREPHLILRPENGRFGGSGGCNRLLGSYRIDGERIELSPAASTMMACPEGMDTERALIETLGRVATWRIIGEHLELFDANGAQLARLERRLMP